MNAARIVSSPTRNRRLNEILGLVVLAAAVLLLLALASYAPGDASYDTVAGYAKGPAAHNWTGLLGAFIADCLLQLLGIAAFFLPFALGRVGVCWVRSRPAGSPWARITGLALWVAFAPAAVALLPGHLLWRGAVPVEGLGGLVVAQALLHLLNLPGTIVVLVLTVMLSLYLATTFSFETAREWALDRFGMFGLTPERWEQLVTLRFRRRAEGDDAATGDGAEVFGSKREKLEAEARRERERQERLAAEAAREPRTLFERLFGWIGRRSGAEEGPMSIVPEPEYGEAETGAGSVWQAMPRMNVDSAPVTALATAAAAAAPYASALAAAAAPLPLLADELDDEPQEVHVEAVHRASFVDEDEEEPFAFVTKRPPEFPAPQEFPAPPEFPAPQQIAPELPVQPAAVVAAGFPAAFPAAGPRLVPPAAFPRSPQPMAAVPLPQEDAAANISFGKRADARTEGGRDHGKVGARLQAAVVEPALPG